jgi:hypothetical protein
VNGSIVKQSALTAARQVFTSKQIHRVKFVDRLTLWICSAFQGRGLFETRNLTDSIKIYRFTIKLKKPKVTSHQLRLQTPLEISNFKYPSYKANNTFILKFIHVVGLI